MNAIFVVLFRCVSAPTVPLPADAYTGDPGGSKLDAPLIEYPFVFLLFASAVILTGSFSPVKFDSSMVKSEAFVTRISAGIRSPVVNITKSPGTSCAAITLLDVASTFASVSSEDDESISPSLSSGTPVVGGHVGVRWLEVLGISPRMRCAWFGTKWLRASIDFSDLYSCMNPTETTIVTATAMLIASSLFPTNTDAPAEQSKRTMRGSLNCFKNRSHNGSGSS